MGSEFAYEDVGSDELEKYTYRFLSDDIFNKRPIWKYERYPISDKSDYSKHVIWLDKTYYQPLK